MSLQITQGDKLQFIGGCGGRGGSVPPVSIALCASWVAFGENCKLASEICASLPHGKQSPPQNSLKLWGDLVVKQDFSLRFAR